MADINADSLHQTVLDLQNFGNRYALREGGNQNVAEYVAGRLNAYGIPAIVDTFHESGNHWIGGPYDQLFYNVKGILAPSAQADDSLVLIGAHLDAIAMDPGMNLLSYTPGADDNASGMAVMLEMARICHLHGLQFSRPVHFMAYDGEELGLFGSVHDAWVRQDAGEKIAVMLFCGLIMGDHSKCGINSMFNTGTVVGVGCGLFGTGFHPKFVPSFSFGTPGHTYEPHNLDKLFETARIVMARRHKDFDSIEQNLLKRVYEITSYSEN